MKSLKPILLIAVMVVGAAQAAAALAHGGRYYSRPRVGVYIGAPLLFAPFAYPYYRPYYYPPYYYPPAVVVRPAPPPVYVEKGQSAPSQQSGNYWYYCPDSQTYYPYVEQCSVPWQRVVPQPPAS